MSLSPRARTRWLRWTGNILFLILLLAAVQWWQARGLHGGQAPALSGQDLEGHPVELGRYRGQPVLVHFWATWCPICRLGENSIANLAADYAVLTIATRSGSADALQQYLDEAGLTFPVVVDDEGTIAARWRVRGVPVSYILDGDGNIAWAGAGYTTELGLRARLLLAGWNLSPPL